MKKERLKINNKKIIPGVLLISIGVVWILSNLNLINIDLYSITIHLIKGMFDLWPLILIIVGIGIIVKNDLLNTVLWVLFLAFLIIYSLFIKGNILERNSDELFEDEVYVSDMREDILAGYLKLDVGATSFTIDSIDDKFIRLVQDGAFKYEFDNKESVENLYISNKTSYIEIGETRDLDLSLNRDIPWDINMNIGAVSAEINLKDIIVKQVILDMGAGNLEMTLGKNNDFTFLDIDAGASKIIIHIPQDVGLRVDFDGGLNSTNLDSLGLLEMNDKEFLSENYDKASIKYELEVDMGMGSFEIIYY